MNTARCSICRQQLPTLKLLISHYLVAHSKLKIIKQLLKTSILQSTPNLLTHKYKCRPKKFIKKSSKVVKANSNYIKTKTIYLKEDVQILCSQNEIIIGDGKSNVEMEFSFDDNSSDSKENFYTPLKDNNGNIVPTKKFKFDETNCKAKMINNDVTSCSYSPSASSEGSNDNSAVVKRKIKRKKDSLRKMRHYRINITKLKDQQSLNEQSGEFYICHCKEKYKNSVLQKSDIRIITSDTESCSDTSKNLFMPIVDTKVFCNKCGNGYNNQYELAEHMHIHETFCRLCNESFPNEFIFKEHMRLHIYKVYICHVCYREFHFRELLQIHFDCHIEDRTFDTVLDMEEDYNIHSVTPVHSYQHRLHQY